VRRDAWNVAVLAIDRIEVGSVCGPEQLLETVDHEIRLLEVIDQIVRQHHALQRELDPVRFWILDRVFRLALR
jgi:hypothetical protein